MEKKDVVMINSNIALGSCTRCLRTLKNLNNIVYVSSLEVMVKLLRRVRTLVQCDTY